MTEKKTTQKLPRIPVKTLEDLNYNANLDVEELRNHPNAPKCFDEELIVVPDMFAGKHDEGAIEEIRKTLLRKLKLGEQPDSSKNPPISRQF